MSYKKSLDASSVDAFAYVDQNGKQQPMRNGKPVRSTEATDMATRNDRALRIAREFLGKDKVLAQLFVHGQSIRSIAAEAGQAPSTVLRQVRKKFREIERWLSDRDDDGDAAGVPARLRKPRPDGHGGRGLTAIVP